MAIFSCCFPNFLISLLSLSYTVVLLSFPLPALSLSLSLSLSLLSVSPPPLLRPCCEGRFQVLANNNLQVHQVTKADEGVYRCEASVEARGEIDFVDIAVVVNGEFYFKVLLCLNICDGLRKPAVCILFIFVCP